MIPWEVLSGGGGVKKRKSKIFYGYVVVAASFAIMTVAWGTNRTFGVFLDPMVREFGWTRAGFSGAFTLGMINLGLISLLAGRLTDQFGPRALLIACSLFLGAGYALSSRVQTLWHLYLFYGFLTGIGMSGAWAPIMSVVTRWFVKNRSLMSGLIAAGPAIGIAALPPLFSLLLESRGWRFSFLLLGGLSFLVIFTGALFLKRDPAEIGVAPYGAGASSASREKLQEEGVPLGQALRAPAFWLLNVISFCDFTLINVIAVHIVPHAIQLEISPVQAATVLSLAAGVSIPGRIFMGGLADRIGNRTGFFVCLTLSVAAFIVLQFARTLGMLYLFAILYGLGLWATGAIMAPYLADLFGLKSHGSIFAGTVFSGTLGGGLGPALVGYTFDATGDYRLGFLLCLFASVAAWLALYAVRPTRGK
jgi:MFS family permease